MNVIQSFSLAGKVVLLTGGAGKYGRQITAALADASVYITGANIPVDGGYTAK